MKDNKALKYLTLITGVLTLLLGVYTLVRPMRTFLAIGQILGILLFVNGIELVILSLSKEKKEIGACILGVLEGLAGIILLFSGIQRFLTLGSGGFVTVAQYGTVDFFQLGNCRLDQYLVGKSESAGQSFFKPGVVVGF